MAEIVTWALKMRSTGLYLTERNSLMNVASGAKRFRTVVGAADYRARNHPTGIYAIVKLTKRSGAELAIHRVASLFRKEFTNHLDIPPV